MFLFGAEQPAPKGKSKIENLGLSLGYRYVTQVQSNQWSLLNYNRNLFRQWPAC